MSYVKADIYNRWAAIREAGPREIPQPELIETRFSYEESAESPMLPTRSSHSALYRAIQALQEYGYINVTRHDLIRLTRVEKYEDELHVMADVRAYFQVAYKACVRRLDPYHYLTLLSFCNPSSASSTQFHSRSSTR